MSEADIQHAILDYLTLKRHFAWRNNSGAFKTDRGRFMRFGTPGSPDIFCLSKGLLYGIEVKSPTGKLSDHQQAFKREMEAAGGVYLLARSLDDVQTAGL